MVVWRVCMFHLFLVLCVLPIVFNKAVLILFWKQNTYFFINDAYTERESHLQDDLGNRVPRLVILGLFTVENIKIWVCHMHIIEEKVGQFSGEIAEFSGKKKKMWESFIYLFWPWREKRGWTKKQVTMFYGTWSQVLTPYAKCCPSSPSKL